MQVFLKASLSTVFIFICFYQLIPTFGQILPPDNSTCVGVVSNLFRRQLRHILLCTRMLNLRSGHACVLKCTMIREGVLSKDGAIEQKLLDQFVEKFPESMQPRVRVYVKRCQIDGENVNHKEENCKSYEPLYRCVGDAILNFCGNH